MKSYQIGFYKDIFGVGFPVTHGKVTITRARSVARAIEAAKLRFARRLGIPTWNIRADHVEVDHEAAGQRPVGV